MTTQIFIDFVLVPSRCLRRRRRLHRINWPHCNCLQYIATQKRIVIRDNRQHSISIKGVN